MGSAKKFDEFFSENPIHSMNIKRSVPPPPPSNHNKLNEKYNNGHSRHSHSISNRSQNEHIIEHFDSLQSVLSSKQSELPLNIPVYSLQVTNDSIISQELSPKNDQKYNGSSLYLQQKIAPKDKLTAHR